MPPRPRSATLAPMVPLARRDLLAEKGRPAMSVAGGAFAVLPIPSRWPLYETAERRTPIV